VVEAASGLEALEKARALQPDLITLDVMMPDMDGFDVMKVLRGSEETRQIPVIFLSVVQDEAKGLRLGASDYLTKPIDPERLLATVSRALPPEEARESTGVLVIDDDPDIVQVLSHTLGRAGYRVSTASNGHDGLTRLFNEIPDLVILDLKMPGMSGYEVIRQVRSTRRVAQIPILVLTASDVGDGRERALALGANEYLRKPISNDQLLAEISRLVHAVGAPASAGVAKG
jgi:CheY-like chemotaxis protein